LRAHLKVSLPHTTSELLKERQYERVAQLVYEAQLASEQDGDGILADVLAAARQICLACGQYRAEEAWHQRAYNEAERRENELEDLLQNILDLVSEHAPPLPSTAGLLASERDLPEPEERLSLWQRIQNLLGRGSSVWPYDRSVLGISAIALPHLPVVSREEHAPPSLIIYCLGPLRVYQDDKLITNWVSGKGKAIFRYMIANRGQSLSKDILMDLFWRDAEPEAARNNLNVAIYGLRQTFKGMRPDFSHILFRDDYYLLNPEMRIWIDVEELVRRYEAGQRLERQGKRAAAVQEYEAAESLYQGDFFEEDLYEDWPIIWRESLKDSYLIILDRLSRYYLEEKRYAMCIQLCQKILAKDDCREDAHRWLMRCYSRQGRHNLALRQYDLCVKTLARVLEASPMEETVALYQQIRNKEAV
jgi:DNA-binding SARP family transcriptional activator